MQRLNTGKTLKPLSPLKHIYFKFEKKNERSALAQLSCGIIPLRIETGRCNDESIENRICTCCCSSDVEKRSPLCYFM